MISVRNRNWRITKFYYYLVPNLLFHLRGTTRVAVLNRETFWRVCSYETFSRTQWPKVQTNLNQFEKVSESIFGFFHYTIVTLFIAFLRNSDQTQSVQLFILYIINFHKLNNLKHTITVSRVSVGLNFNFSGIRSFFVQSLRRSKSRSWLFFLTWILESSATLRMLAEFNSCGYCTEILGSLIHSGQFVVIDSVVAPSFQVSR